ncbi:hypothetical protein COOONC_20922 [Cooperia oncophora]
MHALTALYPRHRVCSGTTVVGMLFLMYIPLSILPTWFSDAFLRYTGPRERLPAAIESKRKTQKKVA